MKDPACPERGRRARLNQKIKSLLTIPAALLFAHFTASSVFAQCTDTSFGCIPHDPGDLAVWIMDKGVVLAAFGAAILIVMSGYQLMSSTGDPMHIKEAKGRLTAAVTGFVFILLIELILRTIWSDVFEMGSI